MLYIHGAGHYHPDNILDNAFFESLGIETNNEWIVERVGIHQRRTVLDPSYIRQTFNKDKTLTAQNLSISLEDTIKPAVTMAAERAGISIDQIGMVLASSCAHDFQLPSMASLAGAAMGLTRAPCIDVNTACSSFAAQMHMANSMADTGAADYILLIQVENWTKSIDYSDRRTCVLIGDAVTATIVSKKHPAPLQITETYIESDPLNWQKVKTPALGHFVQDGPAVQKFAIKKTIATFNVLQQRTEVDLTKHYFISHQANLTMLKSVCSKLGILDHKHLYNVDKYGNCAAAGAPSVLSQNWQKYQAGDQITVVVVGAGLTWGGMSIEVS